MVAEKMQVAIKLFPRETTNITVEVQASSLPQAAEAKACRLQTCPVKLPLGQQRIAASDWRLCFRFGLGL